MKPLQTSPFLEADVKTVRAVLGELERAVNCGDAAEWSDRIAEDAVFMPYDAPEVSGPGAAKEWGQAQFDDFTVEEKMSVQEVEVAGEWAFVRYTFDVKATPKEEGETVAEAGKALAILRKQADGSWKLYRGCWNLNAPAPELGSDS